MCRKGYKAAMWSAGIGFALPLCWGISAFILFNLRNPFWVRVFWSSVYITCPAWAFTPGGGIWTLLTPFLNALFYFLISFILLEMIMARRAPKSKPTE